MSVARCATLVGGAAAAVAVGATIAWLSVPDLAGIAVVFLAIAVAAAAWLVLLVATIRRRTRRRWLSVVLMPAVFALLFPLALHWHGATGPWVEFLLRRQALARVAALAVRGDGSAVPARVLADAGTAAIEARPDYVALQHRHAGWFSNYGFVHVSPRRAAPRLGTLYFGEPVTDLLPLRDGWFYFETSSLALAD